MLSGIDILPESGYCYNLSDSVDYLWLAYLFAPEPPNINSPSLLSIGNNEKINSRKISVVENLLTRQNIIHIIKLNRLSEMLQYVIVQPSSMYFCRTI